MVYQNLYELVDKFIFNFSASTNTNADLVCTLVATLGSIFLIALPFMVVWKVAKMIIG